MANNNENVLTFGDKSYSSEDLTEEQVLELEQPRHEEFFTGRLIASLNQEDSSEVG